MNQSRRDFFKQALGIVGAVAAAPALLKAILPSVARAEAAPTFVVPGQGMAASVGYVEDKTKAPKDKQVDRNGVKFADQKCSNCAIYTKDASGKGGKCALFSSPPGLLVKDNSWCASWSKK